VYISHRITPKEKTSIAHVPWSPLRTSGACHWGVPFEAVTIIEVVAFAFENPKSAICMPPKKHKKSLVGT
jgi:hypothetical protein